MAETKNLMADIAATLKANADTLAMLAGELAKIAGQPGQEKFVEETPFEEVKSAPEAQGATSAVAFDDLRKLCAAVSASGKTKEIKAIITEAGATRLSDIPEDKWQDIFAKVTALKEAT